MTVSAPYRNLAKCRALRPSDLVSLSLQTPASLAITFLRIPNLRPFPLYLYYYHKLVDSLSLFATPVLCFQHFVNSLRKNTGGCGMAHHFPLLPSAKFACLSCVPVQSTLIPTHLCPELKNAYQRTASYRMGSGRRKHP